MSSNRIKRSAPSDFGDEPKRASKIARLDGDTTSTMRQAAPTAAQRPPAKRKLEQQESASNPLPSSKRVCRSIDAGVDASERLLRKCRGGGRRRQRRVVKDSDDENADDDKGDKIASKQRPATPQKEAAAQASESQEECESTSSSQKPTKETGGRESRSGSKTPIETTIEGSKTDSSGSASSPRKTVGNAEGSEYDSSKSTSNLHETGDSTESDKKSSSEPISGSHKTADSIDSTTDDPTRGTSEPASSSEKDAHESSSTTDTKSSAVSPSEKSSNDEASEKTSKHPARLEEKLPRNISGLLNNSNQCFSNSVIQLFDAAFEDFDLDTVLGPIQSTKPFTEPMLKPKDKFPPPPKSTRSIKTAKAKPDLSKMGKIKSAIGDKIKKLRGAGKLKALSPRKHMRALLHRLRQIKGKGQSEFVSPIVFQQILAHGDETTPRGHSDGQTQEDAFEYLQATLNGLKEVPVTNEYDEEAEAQSATIDSLFNITSETATVCSNTFCDHKGSIQQPEIDNAYTVHVANMSEATDSLLDLINEQNRSQHDQDCPKCGGQTERVTEFTSIADNFVINLHRGNTEWSADDKWKVKTRVEVPTDEVELCGKQYALNAIIRHFGDTLDGGHYTVLRKRSPEWSFESKANTSWVEIDDHKIYSVDDKMVQDQKRDGQNTILLFKAVA